MVLSNSDIIFGFLLGLAIYLHVSGACYACTLTVHTCEIKSRVMSKLTWGGGLVVDIGYHRYVKGVSNIIGI